MKVNFQIWKNAFEEDVCYFIEQVCPVFVAVFPVRNGLKKKGFCQLLGPKKCQIPSFGFSWVIYQYVYGINKKERRVLV